MILDSSCVHWWIIGRDEVGHCKKCGEIRDFENIRLEEKTRLAINKKKR